MSQDADAIVVGAGLAGLVATAELAAAGRRVIVVEQEPAASVGGQAFWSFGGLFIVNSPEQRRMGIRDSHELALQDWLGSAGFERPEDEWPRRWAEAYVEFAAGEKRAWLHAKGVRFFPVVGWAERGGYGPTGHGNSVPRFHITWGTGPGVVAPFERELRAAIESGRVRLLSRHRVDELTVTGGAIDGVRGSILAAAGIERGQPSTREVTGDFKLKAHAVLVTSGGIGGNHELVRKYWPARMGTPPEHMLSGVPAHVDGRMLDISRAAGAAVINQDRMWHYTEGIDNWNPIWPGHGIRILPGPSSLWLDARGDQLPGPLFPGFDTLGTLEHIMTTGYDYTWFVLTQKIIEREFALSGSEQNPDLTGKSIAEAARPREARRARTRRGVHAARRGLHRRGQPAGPGSRHEQADGRRPDRRRRLTVLIEARDREVANPFTKDMQLTAIHGARRYRGDRLIRVAKPHRFLDAAAGPLIAVRLHILTRKSLGGLHTNLDAQVLDACGQPIPGLYAAGEVAGFGGGGLHGYRALEGTFLGGCLFLAGQPAAARLAQSPSPGSRSRLAQARAVA